MRDTSLLQLALALTPPWTVSRADFEQEADRGSLYCGSPETVARRNWCGA